MTEMLSTTRKAASLKACGCWTGAGVWPLLGGKQTNAIYSLLTWACLRIGHHLLISVF
jgi:hypothetical protein